MTTKRLKRPTPERTGPIRSMSSFLKASAQTNGGGEAGTGSPGNDGRRGFDDVVARSVDLGYRVIDEYVRQGQRVAQGFSDRSYTPQAMTNDFQELTGRLAQYASDFASVWIDLMRLAAQGSAMQARDTVQAAPVANASTPAPATQHGAASAERVRVRVRVASARPAEVSVDLQPQAPGVRLLAHSLRAVDPTKPRLDDIVFEQGADGAPPELRIRIPMEHPPGTYSGLIIDEATNRPAGTVSVRIGDS